MTKQCAKCSNNSAKVEVNWSIEHQNYQCFFCFTEWKKVAPVKLEKPDTDPTDILRKLNERLHAKIKEIEIDNQVACLEVHRLYAPDWEQHHITAAIDTIRRGWHSDFVPIQLLIEQAEQGTDEELEKCREILRRK